MRKSRKEYLVERCFDGEYPQEEAAGLLKDDPEADTYRKSLDTLRAAARAAAATPEIAPAQFPAFMDGIRQRVAPQPRGHRGFWAFASAMAAASIVAAAAFLLIVDNYRVPVAAEIEHISTDIPGAEVHYRVSDDGMATMWVEKAEGDL